MAHQKKCNGNHIAEAFNVVERNALDKAFARAFYASALSFYLSRCPTLKSICKFLIEITNINIIINDFA